LDIIKEELKSESGKSKKTEKIGQPIEMKYLYELLLKYDINCLLHGLFLSRTEIANGRYKLRRALSAFMEAYGIERVVSGGTRFDKITPQGNARQGYGNVLYSHTPYTAKEIQAFFNLDLKQIREYGLGETVENLLITIALWQIQKLLENGLQLRATCNLEVLKVKKPEKFEIPTISDLSQRLSKLIKDAKSNFTNPPVTKVIYAPEEETDE